MSGVLARILASKRAELASMKAPPSTARRARSLDVLASLRKTNSLALIAEIKKRSPSAGALSTVLSVGERAVAYARAGASMVSVLCDGPFFGGAWDDLATARRALDDAGLDVPLLAKEFVLDPVQLDLARSNGADAVLVIARLGSAALTERLVSGAIERGLAPLVEVTNEDELAIALAANAGLVGVNARDLDTLELDRARADRVLGAIPRSAVAVHLSGLSLPEHVAEVAAGRADAALIGEALMRRDDPGDLLKRMVTAAEWAAPRAR